MEKMKLVCAETGKVKSSFDAISRIVEEVLIVVDSGGFRLDALNKSQTTMIHHELNPGFFDDFQCPEPMKLGVDTEELMKALKRVKADDIMTITADEGNLILIYDSGDHERKFKIRLIDIEYAEKPKAPDLEYPVEVEVPVELLKNSIQDAETVSDKITMMADEDHFRMMAEGEFGDNEMKMIHGANVDGMFESIFSLELVKEMTYAEKFSDIAKIKIGNNMPLYMTLPNPEGELSFMLAPRIEQEV
jgi:proliferating cell nuclear antigen